MTLNIYALPLLGSGIFMLFISFWSWRLRETPGAKPLAFLTLAAAVYALGYALEISSTTLPAVLFWLKVEYLGLATLPAFFLLFALSYTGRGHKLTPPVLAALFLVPLLTIGVVFTNESHQLYYRAFELNFEGPFPVFFFERGPWYWVNSIYMGLAVIASNILLLVTWFNTHPLYRKQINVVLVGSLVPWGAHLAYPMLQQRGWFWDPGPFALTLSAFLIFWALYRYRLLELTPVIRTTLFEEMPDGVLVLDRQRRLADLNKAARDYLQLTAEALGKPAGEVLSPWPELIARTENAASRSYAELQRDARWFRVDFLPLQREDGISSGQILLLREITEGKQAEEALKTLSEEHEKVFHGTRDALFLIDVVNEKEFRYIRNNHAHQVATGLAAEDMRGKTPRELLGESTGEIVAANYRRCVEQGEPISYEETLELPAGKRTWFTTLTPGYTRGRIGYLVGASHDITGRKEIEQALQISEGRYRLLVENANEGILVVQDGRHKFVNPMAVEFFGRSEAELTSTPFIEFIHPEDRQEVKARYEQRIKGEVLRDRYSFRIVAGDGAVKWAELKAVAIEWEGRPATLNFISDITERKLYEEKLKYLSLHDQLTGLYNRAFFEEEMKRLAGSRDYPFTIISADLDELKRVNDTQGHAKGDELLQACARVLSSSLRSSDILARIGGDEFAVLLPRAAESHSEDILRRIQARIDLHNLENPALPLSVSLGIATAADKSVSLEDTYKQADASMYRRKLSRRGSHDRREADAPIGPEGEEEIRKKPSQP